ncbi:MAG TPA: hypothetical protein VN777_16910, partial [Terriglobales bacterium]|nr:hypothetical protein [Terriglobales bacterium]HZW92715.1 hypothetical protein [Candidatus Eremiobacteraceae bacterium]
YRSVNPKAVRIGLLVRFDPDHSGTWTASGVDTDAPCDVRTGFGLTVHCADRGNRLAVTDIKNRPRGLVKIALRNDRACENVLSSMSSSARGTAGRTLPRALRPVGANIAWCVTQAISLRQRVGAAECNAAAKEKFKQY